MDLQLNLLDLHSNLQEDPPLNLQADLQKDLHTGLQMDLQANLQVRTGLEATQNSPLVSFQAETSTGKREDLDEEQPSLMLPDQCTSMGGTCEQRRLSPGSRRFSQGPKHVIGELPIKSSARRKFGSACSNLQGSTRTYTDLQDSPHHRTYTHTSEEEQCSLHSLRCLQQHPDNALTPRASSLPMGISGYTIIL